VRERRLGVGGYAIGTSMLAIINGLICVLNRLRDMVVNSQRMKNRARPRPNIAATNLRDMDESCFSTASPFRTVRLIFMNCSKHR
jgi:hypothetical protein